MGTYIMSFLSRLKSQLEDPRRRGMSRDQISVDRRALEELIMSYEQLDTAARSLSHDAQRAPIHHRLASVIEEAYRASGQRGDQILLTIMETLTPLIQEFHNNRWRSTGVRPLSPYGERPVNVSIDSCGSPRPTSNMELIASAIAGSISVTPRPAYEDEIHPEPTLNPSWRATALSSSTQVGIDWALIDPEETTNDHE